MPRFVVPNFHRHAKGQLTCNLSSSGPISVKMYSSSLFSRSISSLM